MSELVVGRREDGGYRVYFVNFTGANLKAAIFDNSQMNGVNLRLASLRGSSLRSCNLRYAIMAGTDMEVGLAWLYVGRMFESKSTYIHMQ